MRHIYHTEEDIFFNLALEEYLLHETDIDCFMLWQSEPAVVLGKHQNALAEINLPFVLANDIKVARRLSGGGTVFHGPGNLNFTFIANGSEGKLIDFRKHTAPVIAFLKTLGVNARSEGKNDLRVEGLKISGNAEHVYKKRVLHHGTLLYDAPLHMLNEAIKMRAGRYRDKSVQSVRSKVSNIISFLDDPPAFEEFRGMMTRFLKEYFDQNGDGSSLGDDALTRHEVEMVRRLALEKYAQWDWNYAYSPDYAFTGSYHADGHSLTLSLEVKKGIIAGAEMDGPSVTPPWLALARDLTGKRHHTDTVLNLLKKHHLVDKNEERIPAELLDLFF
ncbi:MAG: lipoate--protein ligase [Bacteroidales bacterium]|nr:lipoate--protein ligase [Bacteroidales bacterium]